MNTVTKRERATWMRSKFAFDQDAVDPEADWSTKRWLIFAVQPQKEFAARRIIRRAGFDAFVPIEEKVRRRSRHAHKKLHDKTRYPAMRGYIMIGFRGSVPWHELAQVPAPLRGVVAVDGKPFEVLHSTVKRLIRLSQTNVPNIISKNLHKAFRAGDLARINEGAFRDHVVKIEDIVANKARTTVNVLGKPHEVLIPLASLDAA